MRVDRNRLNSASVRMCENDAIGDNQCSVVPTEQHFVRTDAMGRKLRDLSITVHGIAHADGAPALLEVALGGAEVSPVAGEDTVTATVFPLTTESDPRV